MATAPQQPISPEEYLQRERKAEGKSEYFAGEIFAMAGATRRHSRIVKNITSFLDQKLDQTPCDVDASELRVLVSATGLYTYPDVVVTCGEEQFLDNQFDTLLNPLLIIEVLSPSTEDYDRGKKFANYRTIPSLREYVMVAQDRMYAERYWFQEKGKWIYTEHSGPDAKIPLVSIEVELPMTSIYRKLP